MSGRNIDLVEKKVHICGRVYIVQCQMSGRNIDIDEKNVHICGRVYNVKCLVEIWT